MEFSAPAVPEQNGTAERSNRTLLDSARALLLGAGLSPSLWGYAVQTATYLLNRTGIVTLGYKTPFELFWQQIPDVSHLRVFGAPGYPLLTHPQSKFAPREGPARPALSGYLAPRNPSFPP